MNKVRLMEAKQERDELVRTFVARLHTLANICLLSTQCKGGGGAAYNLEPSILLALVKGLYEGDTKGEVLSKVTQMNLKDTIAFVEAREIDIQDVQLLVGGPSSVQVNAVLVQGKCWRWGQEGHSGQAPVPIRKSSFKALNSTFKKCGQVGQYTSVCKKPGDKKTKEEEVTAD